MHRRASTHYGPDEMTNRQEQEPARQPWRTSRKLRSAIGDFRTKFARRRSRGEISSTERELFRADTPADVTSVRAKSSRHGKSTADKWNQ
jgi:hypothetical protein